MADVVINGSDIVVFAGSEVVAHGTSHSLGMTMATRETSNKDTGKFNTKAPARLEVTASCEALVVYTDLAKMAQAILDRVPLLVAFGQRDSDNALDEAVFYAEGMFLVTSLDMNAGDQENATYTASFEHSSDFALSTEDDLRAVIMKSDSSTDVAGFAAVFPKKGTAPYSYLWSSTATTQYDTGLAPGTHTCTITDSAGTPNEIVKTVVIGGVEFVA